MGDDPGGQRQPDRQRRGVFDRPGFVYQPAQGGWRQAHHHGSIDDPAQLRQYQDAVAAASRAVG